MQQEPTVEDVLEELDAIARGLHPSQKTILEEYRKCPDWQLAAQLVAKGIQRLHRGSGQYRLLDVPPGWLPPNHGAAEVPDVLRTHFALPLFALKVNWEREQRDP